MFEDRLTELSPDSQALLIRLYRRHFTHGRFEPYVVACSGDPSRALLLYDWNMQVSAAFWELIVYLEVALRNRINEQLETSFDHQMHWTSDLTILGPSYARNLRDELKLANDRIMRRGKESTPDQIVSELPFGFWVSILSRRSRSIWPELATGFHGMPSRNPTELHRLVRDMRDLRNRIGHHHRVWNLDIAAIHADLLKLASFIDIEFGDWLSEKSQIPQRLVEFEVIRNT